MGHDRIARVVLGLGIALAMAVLAAHPKVKSLEKRLGITMLVSAGLPFLGLGFLFRHPSIGILTDDVLADMRPAFEFGVGWIGFVVGMQFDVRKLDKLPTALGPVIAIESIVPMFVTALLCSVAMIGLIGVSMEELRTGEFARDALILAACAAPSAPVSIEFLSKAIGRRAAEMLEKITSVDEVSGLAMLGVVAIVFRPVGETNWQLPSASAWLLVTLGLGVVLGIVTYVLLRGARSAAEELALLLGAVALSAGMAGYLALSVPVVCAIAGALLANLPMRDEEGFKKILLDVERPLYLIFLLIVGASWRPAEWQGWVLAPVFVFARVSGKQLGGMWSKRVGPPELPPARDLTLALTPQSPISIVLIVSAMALYQESHGDRVRWAINAVIIGAVLTEIVVRIWERITHKRLVLPPEERQVGSMRPGAYPVPEVRIPRVQTIVGISPTDEASPEANDVPGVPS